MDFKIPKFLITLPFLILGVSSAFSQTTYYSRNDAVNLPRQWDDADSWTLNSDGSGPAAAIPQQNDNVVIIAGHSVEINDVNANGGPATSADGLGLANVGAGGGDNPFASSNVVNFYHTGDITVYEGGSLTTTVRTMLHGTTIILGDLSVGGDLINLGNMIMASTATFDSQDDLIISGFSNTRIDITDVANSFTNDDLYIDHTYAELCGINGVLEVGIAPNTPEIQLLNSATLAQVCDMFTITGCVTCPAFGTGTNYPTAPVLAGTGTTLNYTENAVVPADSGMGLTYTEPFLIEATVSVTGNYIDVEDVLALISTPGFSASFNSTSGVLTLSGFTGASSWQTALRNVTYENLSDNPTTSTRTVSFQITDGFNASNIETRDIDITRVNDPPDVSTISGSPGPLAYTEGDMAVAVDDEIEIKDPDDTNLEGAVITISANYVNGEDLLDFTNNFGVTNAGFNTTTGELTLTGSVFIVNYQAALRTVTYENTNDNPATATRTVSFVVNDGDADSPPFSRDIEITPINDPPVNNVPGVQNIDEDNALTFNTANANLISISEVDAGANNIDVTLDVSNGTLKLSTTASLTVTGDNSASVDISGALADINTALDGLIYTPDQHFNGTETLTIASDDNGFTGNPGTSTDSDDITINVTAINDPPVNNVPGVQNIDEDNTLTFNTANANLISISEVDAGANNIDVTLDVSNGTLKLSTTSSLTVTGDNSASVDISGALADINTALDGLIYTPNQHFNGTETLTIASDDNGFTGNPGTSTDSDDVTINVTAINDPPTITSTAPTTAAEDVLYTYTATVTDPDDANNGIDLIWSLTNEPAGMVVSSTGVVTWTPAESVLTSGTVTLTVQDGGEDGAVPDTEDFTITVTSVNDAPVITSTAGTTATEDVLYTYTATVTDPDDSNNGTDLIWSLTNEPADMVVSSTGVVTWTPAEGVLTSGTVTLTVQDGGEDGVAPDTEDFTITVTPFNDPPVITSTAGTTATEETLYTYTATVTDPDDANNGTDLIWSLTNEPSGMVVSATGEVTWTPAEGVLTSGTVTLTVQDGGEDGAAPDTEDFTILVTPVNDPPEITGTSTDLNYTEGDGPVAIDNQIVVSDVDDTDLEIATISLGASYMAGEDMLGFVDQSGISGLFDAVNGDLILIGTASIADYITALANVTYENISIEPGLSTRMVSFVVNDGDDNSLEFTRNILISGINEPPVFVDDSGIEIDTVRFTILEDEISILCVQVSDPESNTVHIESVSSGSNGFDNGPTSDLCFTYSPLLNFNGVVYGNITICDDGNPVSCAEAVVKITILPVNDPPVAEDDEYTVLEDEVVVRNVLDNDTDPDGDILTVTTIPVADPMNGELVLNPDGTFTYTPAKDFSGKDFFTYEVCDTANPAACDEADVTITLQEVEDPVIVYQVLTPNDDNFNDLWVIEGIEQFPGNMVRIFDRWSNLVYQMQGYNNADKIWEGNSNEGITKGELPNGTYYYVISLGDGSDVLKGFVELKHQ